MDGAFLCATFIDHVLKPVVMRSFGYGQGGYLSPASDSYLDNVYDAIGMVNFDYIWL